jgi:aryl-alcohol dehydrogenase-like predicted oxidoreductase
LKSYLNKFVLGTWPLSGDFGKINESEVIKTINLSLDKGITEFDTAPSYGEGSIEKFLGKELRKDSLVNTKVGNLINKKKCYEIDSLKKSFYESLERLRVDNVNILFLHNPRLDDVQLLKINDLFSSFKEKKLIKFSGISLASKFQYSQKTLDKYDVIQDDLNLLNLDYIINKNYHNCFYARSPLASGLLNGRVITNKTFSSKDDHRSSWLIGERLIFLSNQIKLISKNINIPIINFARRFILSQTNVNKVIFGIKSAKQLNQLLEDISFIEISNKLQNKIINFYIKKMANSKLKY